MATPSGATPKTLIKATNDDDAALAAIELLSVVFERAGVQYSVEVSRNGRGAPIRHFTVGLYCRNSQWMSDLFGDLLDQALMLSRTGQIIGV